MQRYLWFYSFFLLVLVFTFPGLAYSQTLEERVDKLEKKVKKNKSSLSKKIDKIIDRMSVQGFMTTGLATHSGSGVYDDTEINDELCFHCDSLIGLQFDFAMGDNYGVTTQMLAKGGADRFGLGMEWTYLYYKPSHNLTLRTGRMRTPFYANSEFLDVGFAYPWARLPKEIYNIPLSTFEGVDVNYRTNLGVIDLELQSYTGSAVERTSVFDYGVDKLLGLVAKGSYESLSLRLGYHMAGIDFDLIGESDNLASSLSSIGVQNLEAEDAEVVFTNAALTYDNGSLYAQLEYANLDLNGFLTQSTESYTGIIGYKVSQWMPYLYYTHTESNNVEDYESNIAVVDGAASSLESAIALLNTYDPSDPVSVATVQAVLTSLAATDPTLSELASDLSGGGNEFAVAQVAAGLQSQVNGLRAASAGLFSSNIIQQSSVGIGVKYNLSSKTAITLEAQNFSDFGDDLSSKGFFENYSDRGDVTMYSIVFNAVF